MPLPNDERSGDPPALRVEADVRYAGDGEPHGFTRVPNVIARTHWLSAGAVRAYTVLCSFAWQQGFAWPGQLRLGYHCAASDRTARAWVRELRLAGLVRVERRGLGLTNRYWLLAIDAAKAAELVSPMKPAWRDRKIPPDSTG